MFSRTRKSSAVSGFYPSAVPKLELTQFLVDCCSRTGILKERKKESSAAESKRA